jgi:hypothetical protein
MLLFSHLHAMDADGGALSVYGIYFTLLNVKQLPMAKSASCRLSRSLHQFYLFIDGMGFDGA